MIDANDSKVRIFKLKPKEWFKDNAYQDRDGDWFESKCAADSWSRQDNPVATYILPKDVFDNIYTVDPRQYLLGVDIDWAVEYELTKEEYPEYFL